LKPQTERGTSHTALANHYSQNRETKAHARPRMTTTRRKISEWSVLEKPVAPLPSPPNRRRIRLSLPFSGAGEGIRTPDPLITNQMLYRLSYASTSRDSLRLGANLSL